MDFTKPQSAPAAAPTPGVATPAAPAPASPFKAATSRFYDATVAARVFKAAGKEETCAAGQVLFAEDDPNQKGGFLRSGSRMYYIAEGEVALARGGKALDIVNKGDVFGEMSVISGRPRSASATAKSAGIVYSMDASELEKALGQSPEFAMMLASVMYDRLRLLASRISARGLKPGVRRAARAACSIPP